MYSNYNIESIRILPNDKETFKTEKDFKDFMEKQLINRDGYYYFLNQMMRCPKNTLVLFQYDGKIRATGVLVDLEKKKVYDEEENEYSGYYKFDVDTIYILNEPIDKNKMQEINPEFNSFNQSKQIVSLDYLEDILEILAKDR